MKALKIAILSLSLLTIMAGAAISPALGEIGRYFSDAPTLLIQGILTTPALFIVLTAVFFQKLSARFSIRNLTCMGLALYIIGGCGAALMDNVYVILVCRAILGISVGIIMPLSTGLISYFFKPEEQVALMGRSSAMNNLGGIVALFFSGILAALSWRYAFLVYGGAIVPLILCFIYLPNEHLRRKPLGSATNKWRTLPLYITAYLTMVILYAMVANFAMISSKEEIFPPSYIGCIMALQTLVAFLIGMYFKNLAQRLGNMMPTIAGLLFILAFAIFSYSSNSIIVTLGMLSFGAALGMTMPLIFIKLGTLVEKEHMPASMSRMSAAIYAGQFTSPLIIMQIQSILQSTNPHFPYVCAIALSCTVTVLLTAFVRR
ncbi:MAG: MFS transporter [Pseudomonadota bacterium]